MKYYSTLISRTASTEEPNVGALINPSEIMRVCSREGKVCVKIDNKRIDGECAPPLEQFRHGGTLGSPVPVPEERQRQDGRQIKGGCLAGASGTLDVKGAGKKATTRSADSEATHPMTTRRASRAGSLRDGGGPRATDTSGSSSGT
jgi:hypothetical protein